VLPSKCDFEGEQFSERLAPFNLEVGLLQGDDAFAGRSRPLRGLAGEHEPALEFLGVPTLYRQIRFGNLEPYPRCRVFVGFLFPLDAPTFFGFSDRMFLFGLRFSGLWLDRFMRLL